jgi:hypothetical protein
LKNKLDDYSRNRLSSGLERLFNPLIDAVVDPRSKRRDQEREFSFQENFTVFTPQ